MMARLGSLLAFSLTLLLGGVVLESCSPPDYTPLRAANLEWKEFKDPEVGYALSHPAILRPNGGQGGDALFRYHWAVPVVVRFVGREDAPNGLWFGSSPVESISLGGKPGFKYVYEHSDGPFSSQTTAYVIAHRGKYLALEFRAIDDLGPMVQQMLESFRLLQ